MPLTLSLVKDTTARRLPFLIGELILLLKMAAFGLSYLSPSLASAAYYIDGASKIKTLTF